MGSHSPHTGPRLAPGQRPSSPLTTEVTEWHLLDEGGKVVWALPR
jgi:hypothetical protein